MGCPLIVKVKDDLVDKGIYNADTFEILDLERFDKLNKSWSNIAKKDYNLNSEGYMFDIGKKDIKLMRGSSYLRDNIKSVWKAFPNLDFFEEFQEKYDEFQSKKQQISSVNRFKDKIKQVKEEVSELFESNPELANSVYEALGIINTSEIQLDKPRFNPDNFEAISYPIKINGKYAGVISVDKDGSISSSIGMAGVELEKEFQGQGYGTKIYIALAEKLDKEGKTLKSEAFGKADINEAANRVWKSLLNKGYAVDKDTYFEVQLKDKQQALQLYSQYLDTIFLDSKVKEIDNSLYNSILNQLEQENKIEKDCSGKLKAEKGLQTNFTKGGKWKLIKDLKGYPTHKEGGVDLTIGKKGVSIKNGNTEFTAKHGLVIPKN